MSMIDLYVAEVGKNLPEKNRADLEQEIRSSIEDALDDARAQGRADNDELVVEVLKKFGPPEEVAAAYSKPRYLIGPKLYPTYLLVLRIVLSIMLVLSAIGVGLKLAGLEGGGQGPLEAVLDMIAGVVGSLIAGFGNVTLVFALLERFLPESEWKKDAWDPRKMKAEPDPERVPMIEPILGVFFTLAALLVLNVYPQWIGISSIVDGEWVHAPVLAPAFFTYLPYLNVLLFLDVLLHALLLQRGHWSRGLRWFQVAHNAASVALLAVMLLGPSLLQLNPADLAQLGWDAGPIDALLQAGAGLTLVFRMGVGVALAVELIEMGTQLYRIFNASRRSEAVLYRKL